jgi:hypothetical protein
MYNNEKKKRIEKYNQYENILKFWVYLKNEINNEKKGGEF